MSTALPDQPALQMVDHSLPGLHLVGVQTIPRFLVVWLAENREFAGEVQEAGRGERTGARFLLFGRRFLANHKLAGGAPQSRPTGIRWICQTA